MADHSPLLWRQDENGYIFDADGRDVVIGAPYSRLNIEMTKANNALILRAVNSHDALLAALKLMIADFKDYPASERPCRAFDVAHAAIAKAEETL